MKREELKVYTLENVEAFEHIISDFESWESEDVFKRDDADSVMDAMERRIARLTALVEALKKKSIALGKMYHKRLDTEQARIKELEAENARLKAQVPKWISVKDMLPPNKKEFIGCSIKRSVFSCWFKNTECVKGTMSHWMPLPPPPTEESSATKKENG